MNLGWSDFFQKQLPQGQDLECVGRVVSEEKKYWKVLSLKGEELICMSSGKLRKSFKGAEAPGVGDWVIFSSERSGPNRNEVILLQRLNRKSFLKRQAAGDAEKEQLLAANIDFAFLTMSLNQDFNRRRLERYLSICREGNVSPIVALTKADLAKSIDQFLLAMKEIAEQVPTIILRRDQISSFEKVMECLTPETTAIVLGSSGVGKSTIINFLLGKEIQRTSEIREDDDKGRHTTTSRSLHILENASMIIDTPGLRELKILADDQSLDETFPDIAALALDCRFADCKHQSEPHCAVKKAIDSKSLSEDRLRHFLTLREEMDKRTKRKRGY